MDIWRNTRRSIKEYAIEVVISISLFAVKEDIMCLWHSGKNAWVLLGW